MRRLMQPPFHGMISAMLNIRIIQADITTLSVDAIVNAARMAVREAMFFYLPQRMQRSQREEK